MRTSSRLIASAAVLGGGLLLAAPASAQVVCEYPFDCPPVGGGGQVPATGGVVTPPLGGGSQAPATGGSTVVTPTTVTNGSAGGGGSLPFTGGEITLVALTGVAALGGGAVLVAAGRKRVTV